MKVIEDKELEENCLNIFGQTQRRKDLTGLNWICGSSTRGH